MLPMIVTLLRHGASTAVAPRRLTPEGLDQVAAAGTWIRANSPRLTDFSTSDLSWALDSALALDLSGRWQLETLLRKPDVTNGETQKSLLRRSLRYLQVLDGRCGSDEHAVLSTHGENLLAYLRLLLGWTDDEFDRFYNSDAPEARLELGHVVQFARADPARGFQGFGGGTGHYKWVRSVCPWDLSRSTVSDWMPIERPADFQRKSNAMLLTTAEIRGLLAETA
jgi:broad specificity phosphatase PhoE